jgi:hypothetical protein
MTNGKWKGLEPEYVLLGGILKQAIRDSKQAMVPALAGASTTNNASSTFNISVNVNGGADRSTGQQVGHGILEVLRSRGLA